MPHVQIALREVVAEPYRTTTDALPAREPSPPRRVDDVVAALGAIPELRMRRISSILTLSQEGRTLTVTLAHLGPVAVSDIKLSGQDGGIAIRVVRALVPLFGAIELRLNEEAILVDGTESADALIATRNAILRKNLEAVAETFDELQRAMAPMLANVNQAREHHKQRRAKREAKQLGLLMLVCVGGLAAYWTVTWVSKAKLGEPCTQTSGCRSECLPSEPVRPIAIGDTMISVPHPVSNAGDRVHQRRGLPIVDDVHDGRSDRSLPSWQHAHRAARRHEGPALRP